MKTKILTLFFLIMPILNALAQDEDDPFADDVIDVPPAAPIDNYMIIALLITIYASFKFFKKQQLINQNNN